MEIIPDEEKFVPKPNTKRNKKHRAPFKDLIKGMYDEYGWRLEPWRDGKYYHSCYLGNKLYKTSRKNKYVSDIPIHNDEYKKEHIRHMERLSYVSLAEDRRKDGYWIPKDQRVRRENSRPAWIEEMIE